MLEEEEGVLLCCLYVLAPSAENIWKHSSEEIMREGESFLDPRKTERIQEQRRITFRSRGHSWERGTKWCFHPALQRGRAGPQLTDKTYLTTNLTLSQVWQHHQVFNSFHLSFVNPKNERTKFLPRCQSLLEGRDSWGGTAGEGRCGCCCSVLAVVRGLTAAHHPQASHTSRKHPPLAGPLGLGTAGGLL